MYNRYIHQHDGSVQKQTLPETNRPAKISAPPAQEPPHPISQPPRHTGVPGFLRNLLPKEFDTGDLIVVLLLLLMARDCSEDQNTALLTLALYFFI